MRHQNFPPLRWGLQVAVLSLLAGCSQAEEGAISLDNLAVLRDQVISGGPPKDGIPALTNPAVVSAASAASLAGDDRVIGLSLDGESRAYPLKILNWHELVNDTLGDQPVLVTYCPLCDSAVVFHRVVDEKTLEFGVSGLLYQSNVLSGTLGMPSISPLGSTLIRRRTHSSLPQASWRCMVPDTFPKD